MEHQYWIGEYCHSQPGLFVLPIESLGPQGVESRFRDELLRRGQVDAGWLKLFDSAWCLYRSRTADLARRAPMYWFPPRAQHVCVVTAPERVRPYFQPFHRAAWLLYRTDFDPHESNVEFAVFQLLQAERMGLMQQVAPALGCNLSYLLGRTDDELEQLRRACEVTSRPDAPAWRSLARALPWLRNLHHETLRPAAIALGPSVALPGTGLIVPRSRQGEMQSLLASWSRTVEQVARAHYAAHARRSRNHAREVCDWLRDACPRVVVTGPGGKLLWEPDRPADLHAASEQLQGITESAAHSLRADLTTIGERSSAFLDSLRAPGDLPAPNPRTADPNGLSYMHVERREIAYNLREASMQRLREPSPPFERWMLAARTVHEWGHLATEAGWVPVRDRGGNEEHRRALAELLDEIVGHAPAQVRALCRPSLQRLQRGAASPGPALADLALSRIEDFQANLVAQPFLSPEERDTYLRNNLRSLVHEYPREAFFQRLVRYAYDYQYLRFSSIEEPREYFLRSTWFAEQYLEPGILDEQRFTRLLETMAAICDTYAVDETRFVDGALG